MIKKQKRDSDVADQNLGASMKTRQKLYKTKLKLT